MIIVLYVLFFAVYSAFWAEKSKKDITEIIPILFSGFVLMLYVLAFFNRMWLADTIIFLLDILIIGYLYVYNKRIKAQNLTVYPLWTYLAKTSVIVFTAVCITGIIALSQRGINSADDWNFWATDIKTIYCLQGFSAKGFNTVPKYGDYPPASQLIQAWFMHIMGKYSEGLMFSAYFLAMQIFSLPILKKLPSRKFIILPALVWMFIIYSFGPNVMYDLSVDVLMGTIYGCVLMLAFAWKDKGIFEHIGLSLILSVLILVKSIGIQWVLFAIVFILIFEKGFPKIRFSCICYAIPLTMWAIWNIFCRLYERTTYLTETLKNTVAQGVDKSLAAEFGLATVKSFFEALFMEQQSPVIGCGLSVAACFIIYLILIIVWKKIDFINKSDFIKLFLFVAVTGIVEYGILLVSAETIFLDEIIYVRPMFMVILLQRYGCPFVIGVLLLILSILFEKLDKNIIKINKLNLTAEGTKTAIWCTVIIISVLISPIKQEYKKYFTYRNDVHMSEQPIEQRKPEYVRLAGLLNGVYDKAAERILIIHDESGWEHSEYTSREVKYYAAPMAVDVEAIVENIGPHVESILATGRYTGVCFVSENSENIFNNIIVGGQQVSPYIIYNVDINDNMIYLTQ